MPKLKRVVAVYEDGTRVESSAADWLQANGEDEECLAAWEKLQAGDMLMMGGGAQPLCGLWME